MSAVPKLRHTELRSLTEVQSKRDNAPECKCGTTLDEDCDRRDVQKCIRLQREAEYGVDDPSEYSSGRGMPKG